MKFLALMIVLLSFQLGAAQDWELEERESYYFLNTPQGTKLQVPSDGGRPRLIGIEKLGEHHLKVVIYTGTAGTSEPVKIYRAALFHNETFDFLGFYPVKYEARAGQQNFPQPLWTLKNNELHIQDEQENINTKIKL